ncbi:hypothetical protein BY996DRAFT_6596376 [Phakopsora pachyrhizi]|nr:hypothetical protein BY996DRAFT_6596376 [Phakopsora pachyrhizi]
MSNNNFPPRNTRNSQKAKNDTSCLPRDNSRTRNDQGRERDIHEQSRVPCPTEPGPGHTDGTGPRTGTSDKPCPIPRTPSCGASVQSYSSTGSITDNWEYPGTPSLLLSSFNPNETLRANTDITHSTSQTIISTHRPRSQDGVKHLQAELQRHDCSTENRETNVREHVPAPVPLQPHNTREVSGIRDDKTTTDPHQPKKNVGGEEESKTGTKGERPATTTGVKQRDSQQSQAPVKEPIQEAEKKLSEEVSEQEQFIRLLTNNQSHSP